MSSMLNSMAPAKAVPYYLVLIESRNEKSIKVEKFIATKIDETPAVLKLVGVDSEEKVETIIKDYVKIMSSTDKTMYQEIMVPWCRVLRVKSLTFKTNTSK